MTVGVSIGAILFTDMVDSTALRSRLGEARADVLRRHHDELLAGAIAHHGGEVARWTGDGVKAVFPAASDAVGAAVAIQRAVRAYGESADSISPFQLRVGVAVGEVSTDESGDRRGVAVVEAARLEALARPGEILATEMVRLLGHRRADVVFEEVGERTLKGLDLPVVVFRVVDTAMGPSVPLPRFLVADDRLPLVGRDDLLGRFEECWAQARAGRSGLLIVRGQPGIGKTRLVSQFATVATAHGGLVLGGTCSSDVDVPYEPLAVAFRAATALDASLEAAVASHTGPLARLFPGGGDEHQPYQPRAELFDAVSDLVRRIARRQPLLLVIDDLHWAAAPSVLLVRHLVATLADDRVLIVGTTREAGLAPTHPMREWLADVRTSSPGSVLEPAALGEVEIATLVGVVAPAASLSNAAMVAEAVCRETAGNPFFAAELLRHMSDTGQLDLTLTRGGGGASTPVGVADVVSRRLATLVPGALELLRAAAVVGPAFDLDLVADVIVRPSAQVLDGLEEAARTGLVTEVGRDRFAFVHAIVRSALLDEMSASRRASLHRSVAEALEARGADQFDELAHHWQMAGADANATSYLMRAAARDMGALAFESAKARYARVIELLNRDLVAPTGSRAQAWIGYAAATRALGDPAFKDAALRAARLARTAADASLMAEAATLSTWFGTNSFWVAEAPDTEMIEFCEATLALLPSSDPMRVRVLATLASHLTFSPNRAQRLALIGEAHRLATASGDLQLTVDVLHAEFACLWEPATLARREQIARDLGRLARAMGDVSVEFLSGFFAAYCLIERGDLDAAEAQRQRLETLLAALHNVQSAFLVARLRVTLDVFRSAHGAQAQVDELFARFGSAITDAEGTWMIQTALLAYQAGTLGGLVEPLQVMTTGPQARMWAAGLAVALLWSGDRDGAAAVLDREDEVPRNYFRLPVMQALGEVAAELDRADRCRSLFDELLPYRGGIGVTGGGSSCFGLVSRTLGVLALAVGEHDTAIELLTEAVEHADRLGAVHEGVSARRSLAQALLAAGRPNAERLLAEASGVAESRGFQREGALISALQVGSG